MTGSSNHRPQETNPADNSKTRLARLGEPLTMSVPDAGWKYYGLGRNSSYDAAHLGLIPTIKIGNKLRVPIEAMNKKLGSVT